MKKIKSSISRNLILSFVLLVTIIFAILAWFSSVEEATASGLSVISTSSNGLQVAFEDVDNKYSDHLVDDPIKKYPLITGNGVITTDGVNLMIPLLNRSTGEAKAPYKSKRPLVANQDYYEADLYFRNDEPLDISLSAGSNIVPRDVANNKLNNKSLFGAFSKDYIAGAARVAFYNVNSDGTESLKKIWIPNEKYELIESSQFSKIEKVGSGSSGISDDPNETFGLYNTDLYEESTYYLWEGHADSTDTILDEAPSNKVMFKSLKSGEENLYYGAVDIETDTEVDHYIDITQSSTLNYSDTGIWCSKNNSQKQLVDYTFNDMTFHWIGSYIDDNKYTITYNNKSIQWANLVVDVDDPNLSKADFFNDIDRFQVLLTYDSSTKLVVIKEFVFYDSGPPVVVGGGTGDYGTGSKSYVLKDNSTVVITGTENNNSHALSFVNNNPRAYEIGSISNQMKLYNSNCMFIVENNGNDTYYLKHLPTGKYFVIDDGGFLQLSDTPSTFVLSAGTDNPVLMCNNFYLSFENGVFFGSKLKDKAVINIYEGSTFSFKENGNTEKSYYYLEANKSAQTVLSPDLYFTDISNCPTLATLETLDDSGYYKAHIKVRIWVEGTDREAKTPLAGGIFNNILKFTGKKIEN